VQGAFCTCEVNLPQRRDACAYFLRRIPKTPKNLRKFLVFTPEKTITFSVNRARLPHDILFS